GNVHNNQAGNGQNFPVPPQVIGRVIQNQYPQYQALQQPPAPQQRTLRETLHPQRYSLPSCIVLPRDAVEFPIKPDMVRLLPTYHGFESEDPYEFMHDFNEVCGTMLYTGAPHDIICLRMFSFSLRDLAKKWLMYLRENTIFSWTQLQQQFFDKFFPPERTNALMKALQCFVQKPNESFAKA
uniref:retrotransposon gag domain-containing protein n=1 Tax=Geminicoccus harenae TaxID=2498453 RepID=UPI001C97CBED